MTVYEDAVKNKNEVIHDSSNVPCQLSCRVHSGIRDRLIQGFGGGGGYRKYVEVYSQHPALVRLLEIVTGEESLLTRLSIVVFLGGES